MSLHTDIAFKAAIMSDADLLAIVTPSPTPAQPHPKPRIYNSAIPVPDENLDNVPVPYIIVMYNGMTNDAGTKDDYECDTDTVQIGIEVAATTRGQLAKIMMMIREAVRNYFINYEPPEDEDAEDLSEEIPIDYQVSASPVIYNAYKPCHWQVLNYQCDTNR